MMDDETYQIYLDIHDAVHNVVDLWTKPLTAEEDEAVREALNESFRFWRRDP